MFLLRLNRPKKDPSIRYRFMNGFNYCKPGIYIGIIMALAEDYYYRF